MGKAPRSHHLVACGNASSVVGCGAGQLSRLGRWIGVSGWWVWSEASVHFCDDLLFECTQHVLEVHLRLLLSRGRSLTAHVWNAVSYFLHFGPHCAQGFL